MDDLAGVADVCGARGLWIHVDGAYRPARHGRAERRDRYDGIERADSFIVDPHKWLFAPYDCVRAASTATRSPAPRAHGQEALPRHGADAAGRWNPADYAYHLSRRARGLPLWFSLATYGTDAYREAVERVLTAHP